MLDGLADFLSEVQPMSWVFGAGMCALMFVMVFRTEIWADFDFIWRLTLVVFSFPAATAATEWTLRRP